MRFAEPLALLLLAVPLARAWSLWRRRREPPPRLGFSSLTLLAGASGGSRARWQRILPWLVPLGLALLVVALARPQQARHVEDIRIKSRNLVLVLDISSSMGSGDFQPGNRLEVARKALADLAHRRQNDLLGLVLFAGRAFLQAPLTPDADLIERMLAKADIGQLPDGTAIGTALALALAQLKDLPPAASTIVLVTDGANNTGKPSPFVAAEAARALGVRIHAIGLSSADTTMRNRSFIWRWGGRQADRLTSADEAILRRIAERSGGRYFRATDPEALDQIMAAIDPMERVDVRIGETRDWGELFPFLLVPGLLLVGAELALALGRLRTVP
ncbi:MAG TPA: VWA domain-containing protein [Gemmatimonadales bacterium]|nr:VWA domain-containing protein [Gemmatimonadales bacterium]